MLSFLKLTPEIARRICDTIPSQEWQRRVPNPDYVDAPQDARVYRWNFESEQGEQALARDGFKPSAASIKYPLRFEFKDGIMVRCPK